MNKNIYSCAIVYGFVEVFDDNNKFLHEKLKVEFFDKCRKFELKIYEDKKGQYVIHKHEKYYLEKLEEK